MPIAYVPLQACFSVSQPDRWGSANKNVLNCPFEKYAASERLTCIHLETLNATADYYPADAPGKCLLIDVKAFQISKHSFIWFNVYVRMYVYMYHVYNMYICTHVYIMYISMQV